ncbi:PHP-associated [uncultured archaeon]|nr:PHP-associated [uncultured archaeon]
MKLDLHLHTIHSADSLNDLKGVIRKAGKLGITPAITDHGNMRAHAELRKMGFGFIAGEEMKTKAGDLIGLCLTEEIPDRLDFLETLDKIKEQGAISYLPHMYDARRQGVADAELARKVDVVEVLNGHCSDECNARALGFADENREPKGAGSDAHLLFEFGTCWVETRDLDLDGPKELLNAIKQGKICGKAKPTIKGVHGAVKTAKKLFGL